MFNISFSQANLFPQGCGGRGGDGEMPEQGDHLHLLLLHHLLKDARRSGSRLLGDDHRGSGVSASGLGSQHNPGGAVSWTTWEKRWITLTIQRVQCFQCPPPALCSDARDLVQVSICLKEFFFWFTVRIIMIISTGVHGGPPAQPLARGRRDPRYPQQD